MKTLSLVLIGLATVAMIALVTLLLVPPRWNYQQGARPTREIVPGDVEAGRALFTGERKVAGFVPCSYCHYIEPTQHALVGPPLKGIAERAASRVPGMSAAEYLYESIVSPDARVVKGTPKGTMFHRYDNRLTKRDIEDIIAYLMTL